MKNFISLLVVAGLVLGSCLLAVAADKGPESVVLQAKKMPPVAFPHVKHQGVVSDCKTCHHNGVEKANCHTCHGVDAKAPDAKGAFHKLCIECHKVKAAGPAKCQECHKKG